jgi:lipopolysaccharide transport system ATP-binding protein
VHAHLAQAGERVSAPAIRVEGLSKRYAIGGPQRRNRKLREALGGWLRDPVAPLRRLAARVPAETLWALQDVSFEIAAGDVVGLIGGNGAGKSTLLKLLTGITAPTRGSARLRGRVASLLEVGTGFHGELTGRENVYLNGAILGMSRAEVARKFDEIVDFSGVERFIDTPVKHYSSGMHVRLGFAVAAFLEPEILFVDEVLAVGDAAFQKKCLGRIQAVSSHGRTVVFVSHNMAAIRTLCRRSLLLEGGRLIMDGDVHACVDRYLSSMDTALSNDVVTKDLARTRPFRSLRIDRVRLQPPRGGGAIASTEPLAVTIDFECVEAVTNLICGFYVETRDGVIPFMVWSNAACRVERLAPGHYQAHGVIDRNFLAPGRYYLGVIVAMDRSDSGDWVPRALEFQVREQAYESIDDFWLQQAPGLLKDMDSKWELRSG